MHPAALNMLRVEEEEMDQSCGTSGPAKITPPVGAPVCVWCTALTQLRLSQN